MPSKRLGNLKNWWHIHTNTLTWFWFLNKNVIIKSKNPWTIFPWHYMLKTLSKVYILLHTLYSWIHDIWSVTINIVRDKAVHITCILLFSQQGLQKFVAKRLNMQLVTILNTCSFTRSECQGSVGAPPSRHWVKTPGTRQPLTPNLV